MMNRTRGTLLGTRIGLADRWWQRARGYLHRPEPKLGEGLLMVPCRVVHMFGMSFPLDVLFLARFGRVVGMYEHLQPGQRTRRVKDAAYALELPSGTIQVTGTTEGDLMSWTPLEDLRVMAPGGELRSRGFGRRRTDLSTTRSTAEMGASP